MTLRENNTSTPTEKGSLTSAPPPTAQFPGVERVLKTGRASERGVVSGTGATARPTVFEYTDYRRFLQASYEATKQANPSFSMSAFARKAGFGENSRAYLRLVIEGRKNLTSHTIARFASAVGLRGSAAQYFEALVHYNQARSKTDREFYFQRLDQIRPRRRCEQFELLRSQHEYFSSWHHLVILQLVSLADFREDAEWISRRLRRKVSRSEVTQAIENLVRIGLLRRTAEGRLEQTAKVVKYEGRGRVDVVDHSQGEMIDRAKESLACDPWEKRDMSNVTMCCDRAVFQALKQEIARFREHIIAKFVLPSESPDAVLQLNVQLFELTDPDFKPEAPADRAEKERKDPS
jgi:uncharacterized protein (TIGR02147 family)